MKVETPPLQQNKTSRYPIDLTPSDFGKCVVHIVRAEGCPHIPPSNYYKPITKRYVRLAQRTAVLAPQSNTALDGTDTLTKHRGWSWILFLDNSPNPKRDTHGGHIDSSIPRSFQPPPLRLSPTSSQGLTLPATTDGKTCVSYSRAVPCPAHPPVPDRRGCRPAPSPKPSPG